jgi:hypothetical protein
MPCKEYTAFVNIKCAQFILLRKFSEDDLQMKYSAIYRVTQEEISMFWAVAGTAILRKQVNMNGYLILNGYRGTDV